MTAPMTTITIGADDAMRAVASLRANAERIRKDAKRRSNGGPSLATWRAARRAYATELDATAARIDHAWENRR